MTTPIPTIHGFKTPSANDIAYMEYLDDLAELPSGESYGLLLFKADPIAFALGCSEWVMERIEAEET